MIEFNYAIFNLELNKYFYRFGFGNYTHWGCDSKKIKFYSDLDSARDAIKRLTLSGKCVIVNFSKTLY